MREPLYLDDIHVGQRFTSDSITVTESEIMAFATMFDPQPFHTDPDAARHTMFRGLVASGWHTAALTMRLFVTSGPPVAGGLIGAGAEISWPGPTRPGDTLHVEGEVLAVTPSRSQPDRGMVTIRSETRNQRGEVAQIVTVKILVPRRPVTPDTGSSA